MGGVQFFDYPNNTSFSGPPIERRSSMNSGLSVSLAKTAFPDTMAVLPCAIATVVHQIVGPIVANFFVSRPLDHEQ